MKIEIGESLIYSYLRHEKQCLITQTNWKSSGNWDISEYIKDQAIYEFEKINSHHEFSEIFKSKIDQTIKQAEIDVLGIDANNTVFAYEVAFHEGGLQYGGKIATKNRIIKKLLRAYITLLCYFPSFTYSIAFCSPKVNPATEKYILEYFEILANEFDSENVKFHYFSNEKFYTEITQKTLNNTQTEADTSELFSRSVKLLALSNSFSSAGEALVSNKANTSNVGDPRLHTGKNLEESIQDYVKKVMRHLFSEKLLSESEVRKLQKKEYCKRTFNLQFPLLKNISEGYMGADGRPRYWAKETFGGQYYVCSQWWKEKTPIYFEKIECWLKYLEENG